MMAFRNTRVRILTRPKLPKRISDELVMPSSEVLVHAKQNSKFECVHLFFNGESVLT